MNLVEPKMETIMHIARIMRHHGLTGILILKDKNFLSLPVLLSRCSTNIRSCREDVFSVDIIQTIWLSKILHGCILMGVKWQNQTGIILRFVILGYALLVMQSMK